MDRPSGTSLRIGAWRVNPAAGQIARAGETVRVEARTMRLLLCLADRAGEVVSIDDLLEKVWTGVIVTPDSVYQAVALLRRLLGDDPKQPTYIATVPRLGYRMVASVSPSVAQTVAPPLPATELTESTHAMMNLNGSKSGRHHRQVWFLITAGAALCLALVVGFVLYGKV